MPSTRLDASNPTSRKVNRLADSRDAWKEKYKFLMSRCRTLENQVRAVEASRENWRQKAKDAEALEKKQTLQSA